MLWTDYLEIATIKSENARDIQTFRYRDDQSVYKVEPGIGILSENLGRARVIFLTWNLESQFGCREARAEIRSGFVIDVARKEVCNFRNRGDG